MNRQILFSFWALICVQMVNGQSTGCRLAFDALSSTCISQLNSHSISVCSRSGTCRSQLADVLSTCALYVSLML